MGPPSSAVAAPSGREDWRHLLLLRWEVEEFGMGSVTVEAGYEKRPSSGPLYDSNQAAARRAAATILI